MRQGDPASASDGHPCYTVNNKLTLQQIYSKTHSQF